MDKKNIAKSINEIASLIENKDISNKKNIAVTNFISEIGEENVNKAIEDVKNFANIIIVGHKYSDEFETYEANSDKENEEIITKLFEEKKIDAAVTMHYPFPIGVSTVGKIKSPYNGKDIYIANTTGTSDIDRNKAMVLNAIAGIIAAKADGVKNPKVGILNVEGARIVEKNLKVLKENGFKIDFAQSKRMDKGSVLRGNDLVCASSDIIVTDSLTGNILVKVFSSFTSGGLFETTGAGYGPSIGKDYEKPIFIVSRASGTPVIREAIKYAVSTLNGKINEVSKNIYQEAIKCGLNDILDSLSKEEKKEEKTVNIPEKEIVDSSIGGIDILEIDNALNYLYEEGIYAESAMGCTGPVIMINENKKEEARQILLKNNFIVE